MVDCVQNQMYVIVALGGQGQTVKQVLTCSNIHRAVTILNVQLPIEPFMFDTLYYVDINECTNNTSGCDHNCTNIPEGYFCDYQDGFQLDNNSHTCNGELLSTPMTMDSHMYTCMTLVMHCKGEYVIQNIYWSLYSYVATNQ